MAGGGKRIFIALLSYQYGVVDFVCGTAWSLLGCYLAVNGNRKARVIRAGPRTARMR